MASNWDTGIRADILTLLVSRRSSPQEWAVERQSVGEEPFGATFFSSL